MQKSLQKSGDFACRHELDRLATTAVVAAQPAAFEQLAELAAIAKKEIPGVNASQNGLIQALRDDPESIYAFQYNGSVLGGIAFLYLNCRGHDALLLDEIDLKNPSRNHLARPGEDVS